jgi:hypothetical protein
MRRQFYRVAAGPWCVGPGHRTAEAMPRRDSGASPSLARAGGFG